MVEQIVYRSRNGRRPPPSINFLESGGGLQGINLEDALNLRCSYLDGCRDPMFEDESIGNHILCRVAVCGHFHDCFHHCLTPS